MYLSPSPQFTTAVNVLVDLALLVSLCFSSSPSLFPQVGGLQLEGCSFDGVHLCENQHDSPSVSAVPPCYMAWVPQVRICVWNSDIFRFTEEICVPETWTDRLRGQQNTFVALLIYILWYNHETNSDLRFFFIFFYLKWNNTKQTLHSHSEKYALSRLSASLQWRFCKTNKESHTHTTSLMLINNEM